MKKDFEYIARIIEKYANAPEKSILAGIDPSMEKCAFAFYDVANKTFDLFATFNCYQAVCAVQTLCVLQDKIGFVIEDASIQPTAFKIESEKSAISFGAAARIGRNIASPMLCAKVLMQAMDCLSLSYSRVNPSMRSKVKGAVKPNAAHVLPTKTNAEYFKLLTGCQTSNNEHERDAATLVYARNWNSILVQSAYYASVKKHKKPRFK